MNIDTLKSAWQSNTAGPADVAEVERLAGESRAGARRYERGARLRLIYGSTAFALTLALLIILASLPKVWPGMRFALLLWSASILACGIGLWRVRAGARTDADVPLATGLQCSLLRIRREIAYQHSLRWWFWVPFGVGFVAAMFWSSPTPPTSHPILLLGTAVLWVWGTINGPRYGTRRLQAQADDLQVLVDSSCSATNCVDGDVA